MSEKNILRNIEPAYSVINDVGLIVGLVVPQAENIRYVSEKTIQKKASGDNFHNFEVYSYEAEEHKMWLSEDEKDKMYPEDHLAILIRDILEGRR